MKSILTLLTAFVLFGLSFTLSSCKKCSKDNSAGRNNVASTPTTPNLNPPIPPLVLTREVAKRVACAVMKEAREAYRAKEAASKALPSWKEQWEEQENERGVADKKIQAADGKAAKAEAARDRALAQVAEVEKLDARGDVVVIERVKFAKFVAMYATVFAAEARSDVALSQSEATEKLRAWWWSRRYRGLDEDDDRVRSAKNAMRDKRLDASDVEAIKRFVEVDVAGKMAEEQGKEALESWEKARDERKNKGFDYEEGEEHDLHDSSFDGEDEEHDLNLGDK